MDSKLLVGLIKEIVKKEVDQKVDEKISKLIKSGAITLNKPKPKQSLVQLAETKLAPAINKLPTTKPIQQKNKQIKEYSKNPILNEVLNMTTPFGKEHRVEGGMVDNSVLDMLSRGDGEWGEINMTTKNMSAELTPVPQSDNNDVNVVMKALNRDYTELVKRFK